MVMQASASPTVPLRPPVPLSALNGRGAVVKFTVNDHRALLETGVIPEDATTELLHGVIVRKDRSDSGDDPTVHGKKHRKSIVRLTKLERRIDGPGQHIQIQLPVICAEDEGPEPDFAIVRGTEDDYDDKLPTGQDTTCVIEVSDSSLERDGEEKLPVYAAAGVPQYIILNLRNRTAQVYGDVDTTAGAYRSVTVLAETDDLRLALPSGESLTVKVSDLLP
jgi:Uma2 family endonuclease